MWRPENCFGLLSVTKIGLSLRTTKHVLCFYQATETRVEVWENKKCCGNTNIWLSKSNCFCTTMPHDWLEKIPPVFQPIKSKTEISRDPLALVFPRFASATCNASSSDWFTGLSVFFVIGYTDYFGFDFTTLNKNRTKNMVFKPISARIFFGLFFYVQQNSPRLLFSQNSFVTSGPNCTPTPRLLAERPGCKEWYSYLSLNQQVRKKFW